MENTRAGICWAASAQGAALGADRQQSAVGPAAPAARRDLPNPQGAGASTESTPRTTTSLWLQGQQGRMNRCDFLCQISFLARGGMLAYAVQQQPRGEQPERIER